MQTPNQFRSLAATLLAARTPAPDELALEFETMEDQVVGTQADVADDDQVELSRDVRLFHARIIEAVEGTIETLVTDIAADVLGRELLLEPVDVEAIVDRALQRFAAEEPLRVRVHAQDVDRLKCGVPVVADTQLRPGDAIIDLRTGSVDASLGVRLAALVHAVTP